MLPANPAPKLFRDLYDAGFNFPSSRPHPYIWVLVHTRSGERVVLGWSTEFGCFFLKGNPHLTGFKQAQSLIARYEIHN